MSLATCFVQSLIEAGHLVLTWISGRYCVVDLLTKILNKDLTEFHRCQIGIVESSAPETWQFEVKKKSKGLDKNLADAQPTETADQSWGQNVLEASIEEPDARPIRDFCERLDCIMARVQAKRITHLVIDMFTNPNAGFSQIQDLPEFQSLGVIAITKNCPVQAIKGRLIEWLNHVIEKCPTLLVLCWVSPPCTGGSPVLNLIAKARRLELQKEHFRTFSFLLSEATPIIEIANIRCLELSKSCTYWKTELIQTNCQLWGLRFMKEYPRCSYQSDQSMTAKHVFRVACNMPLFEPKTCSCVQHLPLNHQRLESLGSYPSALAVEAASWFVSKTRASLAAA